MGKRTVEIDDTLQDRVDGAIAEVEEHLRKPCCFEKALQAELESREPVQ